MRRGYDREAYLSKIESLRRRIPEMTFGTDVIVGFPTETEADFEQTLSLVREVEYDTLYSFTYSARPGTAALELGDAVPADVKLQRLQRLQAEQQSIQERRMTRFVGIVVEVLVDGPDVRRPGIWSGRTPEARVVNFRGDSAPGRVERILVERASPFALYGVPAGLSHA